MQCQAEIQFLDPLTAHPGYANYLRRRMTKCQRSRKDWRKCLKSAAYGGLCRQHAAYKMLGSATTEEMVRIPPFEKCIGHQD